VNGSAAPNLAGGRFDASVGADQSGQAPLQPTVAGRTLDVSAGGEAGLDWANIGSPTTTVGLTGTTVGLVSSAIDAAQLAVGATGAIASAILAATLDNGISLGNLLRGAVRMMLAKRSGYTSGTVKIRDLANTKDSITIVETDDGWTSVTFNDLT